MSKNIPMNRIKIQDDTAHRLAEKTEPVPETGCHIWTGLINHDGYGVMVVHRQRYRVHRLAWSIENGHVPAGYVLDHKCANRCCLNPAHLELVTQAENCRRSNLKRAGK